MDLVCLGEDGGDVTFVGDGRLLEVDLSADLCPLGMEGVCLLGWLIVFEMDLVCLGENVGDVTFAGDGCLPGVDLFVDLCLLG